MQTGQGEVARDGRPDHARGTRFGSSYSDVYDNSIRWTNDVLARLVEILSEGGYLENTLLVIASDHGEDFLERGFEGHGRKVYRESTEVPLLVSLPFRLDPGIVVTAHTRNVDVWPTILDLLGLAAPEGIDGRSRLPDILASAKGEAADNDSEIAIAHLDQTWGQRTRAPQPTVAVVEDTFRYVRVEQPGGAVEQLFDRRDDPRELRDRAGEDPETLAHLASVADGYLAEQPVWGKPPTREIGELELNLLARWATRSSDGLAIRRCDRLAAQKFTTSEPPKVRGSPM